MVQPHREDILQFDPVGAHVDGPTITSAVTLTPPEGATKVLLQAVAQNVRITFDGTVPTATKGFQIVASDPPSLWPLGNNAVIKVIEETGGADLQYQWAS